LGAPPQPSPLPPPGWQPPPYAPRPVITPVATRKISRWWLLAAIPGGVVAGLFLLGLTISGGRRAEDESLPTRNADAQIVTWSAYANGAGVDYASPDGAYSVRFPSTPEVTGGRGRPLATGTLMGRTSMIEVMEADDLGQEFAGSEAAIVAYHEQVVASSNGTVISSSSGVLANGSPYADVTFSYEMSGEELVMSDRTFAVGDHLYSLQVIDPEPQPEAFQALIDSFVLHDTGA
jgi:hypothetical protein